MGKVSRNKLDAPVLREWAKNVYYICCDSADRSADAGVGHFAFLFNKIR